MKLRRRRLLRSVERVDLTDFALGHKKEKIRIALDAMGSDRAPEVEIEGAILALKDSSKSLEIFLVGEKNLLEEKVKKLYSKFPSFEIINAPERVTMHERPSEALKKKRNSSIAIGLELVKNGIADAFISAGNTGAVMGFALLNLGSLKGVRRPAIGAFLPTLKGFTLLLDVGANADAKPFHLFQFAVMGSIFYKYALKKERPSVGILSIGEEMTKGNALVFEAKTLMEETDVLNFVGYVEGNSILEGTADVVVTDGFTGNVILKFGEGAINVIGGLLRDEIRGKPFRTLGALLLKPTLYSLRRQLNYEEYGGAPLLGIDGIVLVAHGRSTPKAIKNAIITAKSLVEHDVNMHIKEELEAYLERV